MSSEKYLVFPFPLRGGMVNLLMELEIRVALAHLSNRTLVSANKVPCWPQPDDHIYKRYRSAAMLDLFDFPIKHISLTKLYKNGFDTLHPLNWQGECASEAYYVHPTSNAHDAAVIDDFKEQRLYQWEFPQNDDDAWFAINQQRTFCNYSYFFLAPDSVNRKVRTIVSRIQPKAHYINAAKKIAKGLGRFNAIHIRRGDFKDWWVKKPTSLEILENIRDVIPGDMPLLILTDSAQDMDFFRPILNLYPQAIFLDDYILENCKADLKALPFSDATVVALLSLLVAVESVSFAGSAFSTFTGYIHRRRLLKDSNSPMLFVSNPFAEGAIMQQCEFMPQADGHFSWNRLNLPNPPQSRANAWFREWPEAVKS